MRAPFFFLLSLALLSGCGRFSDPRERVGVVRQGESPVGAWRHGINLTSVDDYTQTPFQALVLRAPGVDGAPALPVDAYGYPTRDGMLYTEAYGAPDGDYVLRYDGGGRDTYLVLDGLGSTKRKCVSGTTFRLTHTYRGDLMLVSFVNVDAQNPIRNLRMVPAGVPERLFTDEFLARIAPYGTLRLMGWLTTNFNPSQKWSQRTLPGALTQASPYGVAWEIAIELARQTGKDLWINVPAQADEDYVRQLARLLTRGNGEQRLPAGTRVYVEYSNETWNAMFPVNAQMIAEGKANPALRYPGNPYPENPYWLAGQQTAFRTAAISAIFRDELAKAKAEAPTAEYPIYRFVLAGQGANPWLTEAGLHYLKATYGSASVVIDGLALAPYFSLDEATDGTADLTLDRMFDSMKEDIEKNWLPLVKQWGELARANGLAVYAYELGQNLIPNLGDPSNHNAKILAQCQTRMKTDVYDRFLADPLVRSTFQLLLHFSLVYAPQDWGAWGLDAYTFNPGNAWPACGVAPVSSLTVRYDSNGRVAELAGGFCAKKAAVMEAIAADGVPAVQTPTPTPLPTATPSATPVAVDGKPLSELAWQWVVGTVRKDTNATGGTIRVAGVSYGKGLGMTNYNDVFYQLDASYQALSATLAFDDTAVAADQSRAADMTVRILVDGKTQFQAEHLKTSDAPRALSVSLAGARTLEIIASGKNDFSNVVLAGAVLTRVAAPSPSPTPAAGTTAVSALPVNWSVGNVTKDKTGTGGALQLGGQTFGQGWGLRNYSDLALALQGKYRRLTGRVGFDDRMVAADTAHSARMTVEIKLDGKTVFRFGPFGTATSGQSFDLDLTGAAELEIVAGGKDDFSQLVLVGQVN